MKKNNSRSRHHSNGYKGTGRGHGAQRLY
jgi:hypothetical protein